MVLARFIHELLEVGGVGLRRRPEWPVGGRDLILRAAWTAISPPLVAAVVLILLDTAGAFAGVTRGLSFTEDGSDSVLTIDELGGNIEEVGSGLRSTTAELVDECLIRGAVSEGTHDVGVGDVG